MQTTLITEENEEFFRAAVPEDIWNSSEVRIGAVDDDGAACGVLTAIWEKPVLRVTYVYVAEAARGQSYGTALFMELKTFAYELGATSSVASLIFMNDREEDEEDLTPFLEFCGFSKMEDEDEIYTVPVGVIAKTVTSIARRQNVQASLPLNRLLSKHWAQIRSMEIMPMFKERKNYLETVSRVYVENDRVISFLLMSHDEDGLNCDFLYGSGAAATKGMLRTVYDGASEAVHEYGAEAEISFTVVSEEGTAILKKLAQGKCELVGSVKYWIVTY